MPLPVLVVAALLTIAALALQGTRGSNSGSGTVAATGPQLAAFSVTARELSIDQAEAADVPLSGGVAPGALVIEGSATEATEAPTTAAAPPQAPVATVATKATAAPATAKAAATTAAATTLVAATERGGYHCRGSDDRRTDDRSTDHGGPGSRRRRGSPRGATPR